MGTDRGVDPPMTSDALSCAGLVGPLFYCLHEVLKVRENVGVGLVAVFRYDLAINDYVEFPMGAGCEFEGADMLPHSAQRFSCHPGSAEGVASIPAIKNFQLHLFDSRHFYLHTARHGALLAQRTA